MARHEGGAVNGYGKWIVALLLALVLAVTGLAVRLGELFGKAAVDLKTVKVEIVNEVTSAYEDRLAEAMKQVKIEQKRQDEQTANIAIAADHRATEAEKKADGAANAAKARSDKNEVKINVLKKDVGRLRKPLEPLVRHPRVVKKIVEDIAPLVPEPTPTSRSPVPTIIPTPEPVSVPEPTPTRHPCGPLGIFKCD
jgi:hypothetical protein